eukprot:gene4149-2270_t
MSSLQRKDPGNAKQLFRWHLELLSSRIAEESRKTCDTIAAVCRINYATAAAQTRGHPTCRALVFEDTHLRREVIQEEMKEFCMTHCLDIENETSCVTSTGPVGQSVTST